MYRHVPKYAEGERVVFYVDGGCVGGNPGRAVYWSVARKDTDEMETEFFRTRVEDHSYRTNNEAEWLALLDCLTIIEEDVKYHGLGIEIRSDSQLVVNQFNGANKMSKKFVPFYTKAQDLVAVLEHTDIQVRWVPRRYTKSVLGH